MKHKIVLLTLLLGSMTLARINAQSSGGGVIKGKVTSVEDGSNLIGVNVIEMDSKQRIVNATITDYNGNYVLKVEDKSNPLTFSYIGYQKKTVETGNRSVVNVELEEEAMELEEVVIKAEKQHFEGAWSIPDREISTAVQTISTEAFEGIAVTTIDDALQGRIAGLDIVNNSGDPGAGASLKVRGTTSINANQQPLIVVNNIPYEVEIDPNFDFATANQEQYANMLSINPDDIEEITVLKDAASMAVWGSKGANGVLMIKTKKGTTGKTQLQYTYRLTRAVQPEGLEMLNGDDYTMMIKQALFNPRQAENAANLPEIMYDKNFTEYENFNENTNWFEEVTQVGMKHDHYLTLLGGGERARFRVSGGFLTQDGTVIGQKLNRISSRAYLDYWVSDRIQFITEFSYTFSDNYRNYDNLLSIAYRKMPNVSVYQQDIYGDNTGIYYNIPRSSSLHESQRDLRNPVALADLAVNNLKNYRILPTFRLQYYLLDPEEQSLRYNMYVSFDVNNNKVSKFLPRQASNVPWNDNSANYAEDSDSESMTVMSDNNITWEPKFRSPNHSMILYGSFQLRTGSNLNQGIAMTNLPSSQITDPTSEGYISNMWSGRYSYRSNALLLRGHYAFKSKYILTATFRRDGSTKFGNENKYGNFPGISAKWIISDERFMDWSNRWLSMLAIRPSWGISGNQPGEEYLHFSRYQPYGSYIGMSATRPTSIQLSNLKWETTTSVNYGLDLGFFDDRFVFDINFYKKVTDDLLFENLGIPTSSGFGDIPWQNIGIMNNDGWEVNFSSYRAIRIKDFTFDFNFNLANYVNTIIDLTDNVISQNTSIYNYDREYLSRIQENNSFGSIYGFRYLGVYQYNDYIPGVQENAPVARDENGEVIYGADGNPLPMYFAFGTSSAYEFKGGDAIYEDINHDGSIDELDIVYLGNSNPKINGGFGTNLRWKGLTITTFFNFRAGNKIVNIARRNAESMYYLDNQSIAVNWRWRKDGDVTDMPRALYDYGYNSLGSDRYVEDGSFLRFKYLTINYSVPNSLARKIHMKNLRLYLTFNNLATFTKYTGVDPEVGYGSFSVSQDTNATPRSKDVTFGISVSF